MEEKKSIRYSESFKIAVVNEVESGHSINSVRERYGIKGGETISNWIKRYGKNHLLSKKVIIMTTKEVDELKRVKAELKAVKIAYAELAIEHECSELIIKLSDEKFGTDLKKNYEQMLSQYSRSGIK